MRVRVMAALLVLGLGSIDAMGQMVMSWPAAGTIAEPSKAFDAELSGVEGEMMGVVKAMPAEKFGFAPSAAIFVPSQKTEFATVRTFAQQAAHVAQANYSFYAAVGGMKPDVDMAAVGKMTKKEDVVAALAGSFAFAHKAIATLTAANAFEVIKSSEGLQTRATTAAFAVGHMYDHYGQMVEYLRMNGIVPPASVPKK